MKIIFMGTPVFAAHFLEHLHSGSHQVVAVVTQPDRPVGRGRVITPPPVKEKALALGIPVLQPASVKEDSFAEELLRYQADIFVVVAFSILPKRVLGCAKFGAVNVHGSMLPPILLTHVTDIDIIIHRFPFGLTCGKESLYPFLRIVCTAIIYDEPHEPFCSLTLERTVKAL